MPWAEVSLSIPRELAEEAEHALELQGAIAITFEDQADVPVLEPALGTAPLWPVVQLRGLFPAGIERGRVSAALLELPGLDRPDALNWRAVADQDWERAWMDRFQPMKFGERLWIVPTGMALPDDHEAVLLRLDPGLAFGTGTHPTTALCLEWIDGFDFQGQTVVDYGCGSGVLGIAAALKGASQVICVDNDPQALEATTANAVRNGVLSRVCCQLPEQFAPVGASVVLANILAGPLIELKSRLLGSLAPGGQVVLSGILSEQVQRLIDAYKMDGMILDSVELDGWARVVGQAA